MAYRTDDAPPETHFYKHGHEDDEGPPKSNGANGNVNLFEIINLDDIVAAVEPPWLIDRLLPARGLGVAYGLPKTGKSFLFADAMFHVAWGRAWAGREVLSGSVVYFCGEGLSGFKRRLVAFREHYGVTGQGLPFGLIPAAPNLGREHGDDLKVIDTLRAWLKTGRPPLRAIVIDTMARAMPGLDDNLARDMGVLIDNCERIATAFGCIVILIHHAGKDADKGPRGSIALPGALDVLWKVEKTETGNLATIVAMRDGEEGLSWRFRIVPFEGAQQGAANSCVVEILTEPCSTQQSAAPRSKKLKDSETLLLEIVQQAIGELGTVIKGDLAVPHNVQAIERDTLKKYLKPRGYWDDDRTDAHNRAELSRDLKALKARNIVGLTAAFVWLIEARSQ